MFGTVVAWSDIAAWSIWLVALVGPLVAAFSIFVPRAFRFLVEKYFEAARVTYEAEVKLHHDQAIAELESRLRGAEAAYARRSERQIPALEIVSKRLTEVEFALHSWVNRANLADPETMGRLDAEAHRVFHAFLQEWFANRLWLDERLVPMLEAVITHLHECVVAFDMKDRPGMVHNVQWDLALASLRLAGEARKLFETACREILAEEHPAPATSAAL